ncbi:hypothetical protein AB0383_46700 [Amycolatopsis sp. NPDC051373]|uniref:hypothetical protein n=1 Tax=Amycolatopsis sp. NPDC051373 TaxID=3155801 RepID=UPI00344F8603
MVVVLEAVVLAHSWQQARQQARPAEASCEAMRAAWADRSVVTGAAEASAVGGLGDHIDHRLRIALRRGRNPSHFRSDAGPTRLGGGELHLGSRCGRG